MSPKQGWFESDEDFQSRVTHEANERTIENLTGSAPSQGWFESDENYREQAAHEANERIVENSTGESPSQGWFEGDDSYRERLAQEANERIVEDTTGSTPSQGFFESDSDYDVRIRKEANENIIKRGTDSPPKQGFFEGDHDYRSRIAHEAREVRADERPSDSYSSDYSNSNDSSYSSEGAAARRSNNTGVLIAGFIIILSLIYIGSGPNETDKREVQQQMAIREQERNRESERVAAIIERSRIISGNPIATFKVSMGSSHMPEGIPPSIGEFVIWDTGLQFPRQQGRKDEDFLWFGYFYGMEKHGTRETQPGFVTMENYPSIEVQTRKGADTMFSYRGPVFFDNATRDEFYAAVVDAFNKWRSKYPEAY